MILRAWVRSSLMRGLACGALTALAALPFWMGSETGPTEAALSSAIAGIPGTGPVASSRAEGWTDFRGPRRDGHYRGAPILTRWPEQGLKPLWRRSVGSGYASLVLAEGRAFTIEQRGDREVVAAYDMRTGDEIWTHSWEAAFEESLGGDGPRATPTWHDGRIYALGATGELHCLDASEGQTIWSRNVLQDSRAKT